MGSLAINLGCDLLHLAVMKRDGAATKVLLSGRLGPTVSPAPCAVIDGIDILRGTTVVQHVAGGEPFLVSSGEREIAEIADPVADITDRCASEDPSQRFDAYGIVLTGRLDGGTFTAKCAQAEGGSRWPPALRITCHQNLDAPTEQGNAHVDVYVVGGTSHPSSYLNAFARHRDGGAIKSLDTTLHILAVKPYLTGMPVAPRDSTGWSAMASESEAGLSQLNFLAVTDQLGEDLCPLVPDGPPGPNTPVGPAFLARATGTGERGRISTEIFAHSCLSVPIHPPPP